MTTPPISNLKSQILKFFILNFSFFILLSAACSRKQETPPPPPPPVNDFSLKNLVSEFPGEIQTADYAGQVQLIIFFRTDDAPCRGSIPDWNALQQEFAPRGFTLVGAIVDDRNPDVLGPEAIALGAAFPLGLAADPVVRAFGGPAAIRAIPTAFLLSREGTLARAYPGFEPLPRLREDIALLLDGQPLTNHTPKIVLPEDNTP